MYQRKYALKRAITPYWGDRTSSGMASITIGVRYNASGLKGAYKSNSRWHQTGDVWRSVPDNLKFDAFGKRISFNNDQQSDFFGSFGKPDPNWILDRYLEGSHGGYHRDSQGTEEKMNKYFDTELPDRIVSYMETAIFSAVAKRL